MPNRKIYLIISGGIEFLFQSTNFVRFQESCISIIASLWNSPPGTNAFGSATTGSSEAVMLPGLAMKIKWQSQNLNRLNTQPNVIIGENAHICVKKFAEYFDIEARCVPVSRRTNFSLLCSIGVFVTIGTTLTGHYDPVEEISKMLDIYERDTGVDIPIHVDAVSGGFIAPFAPTSKSFVGDFRLPRVKSINASGHKYGQALLAVGWIIWREKEWIPSVLLLESSYLRGTQSAYTLSFSRSNIPVVSQYYQFNQQGMVGYSEKTNRYLRIARILSWELGKTGCFVCLSGVHLQEEIKGSYCQEGRPTINPGIPAAVFTLSNKAKKLYRNLHLANISDALHSMKFPVPNYTLKGWGDNGSDLEAMRIVLREELTLSVMQKMMDIIVAYLGNHEKDRAA
ncbi:hypothetical protein N7493_004874 [Penicillium malachiteum]|uniref:glutamate decarboxylase n=1 Tax=Penicillium malachiteum TaxID=1324776 RepID=A0AAD6HMA7_9EURO|nr:hypothetical protein N7493_004874 [Penicillium malachiteum]